MKFEMSVAAFCAAQVMAFAAGAAVPVSVTEGARCEPPKLPAEYVAEGPLESVAVPFDGWKLVWPAARENGRDVSKEKSGFVSATVTNMSVRGVMKSVLRLEFEKGDCKTTPVFERPFSWNAADYNLVTFSAKIEMPKGATPLLYESKPIEGWFAPTIAQYYDDFSINAYDGVMYNWAADGLGATDYKNHYRPETLTPDGFGDFVWDVVNEERFGYKGFLLDHVKALQLIYNTNKLKPGEKVVIYLADVKFTKGAHVKFDEPERYAAWLDWVKNYKPDLSDSSEYLEPPKTGRLGFFDRIRLVKDGVAQGEIVVDLSDEVLVQNRFAKETWYHELRASRGFERAMARAAATRFQRWLKTLTGADFPVLAEPSAEENVKIFLGPRFAKDLFPEDLKFLSDGKGGPDGFAVRVRDGNVYIFGAHPLGTQNGAFAFLENNTDVIFAFAGGPDGAVYTVDPDLEVVWGDALEKPAFIIRGWQGGEAAWQFANRSNYPFAPGDGFGLAGGHYFSPQYYEHTEGIQRFNPVLKGKKITPWSEGRTLCCLSEPDFLKHQLDGVPCVRNLKYVGDLDACVFGTDDNFGACECEKCTAPRKGLSGRMLDPKKDIESFYGAWFWSHINKMDDEIQKVKPGFETLSYAYFYNHRVPDIKLNKTVGALICNYYRKAYNQPVFAPVNARWWQAYRGWSAGGRQTYLYDYYGLGFIDQPLAEVHAFDLRAQRDIGFLRNSTEGFGNPCLCGDERWCMTRLEWNPDADVEQLHRYFNRRTYREAAPWVDRYRGRIRECWYRQFPGSHHLNDNSDVWRMVDCLGLKDELIGYLEEGLKAAKHPHAKREMERLLADAKYASDWKHFCWAWPSAKMAPKKPAPKKPEPSAAETEFRAAMKEAKASADRGDFTAGTNALVCAMERASAALVDDQLARGELVDFLSRLARWNLRVTAGTVIDLFRRYNRDDFKKQYGWSRLMNDYGWFAIGRLAEPFFQRRTPEEAVKVYDAWINWDGQHLPCGLRQGRVNAKIDTLRRNKVDETKYMAEYTNGLKRVVTGGANPAERGAARLRLYKELCEASSVDRRLEMLFEIIDDKFMNSPDRQKATLEIPDACTVGGKTDWKRVAENGLRAFAAGDWSGQWRNSYHAGNATDLRLDALLKIVERMEKAEAREVAADFIVKGATTLGYTKDATKESLDKGGPGVWAWSIKNGESAFDKRVKKLDDAMTRLGVSRK